MLMILGIIFGQCVGQCIPRGRQYPYMSHATKNSPYMSHATKNLRKSMLRAIVLPFQFHNSEVHSSNVQIHKTYRSLTRALKGSFELILLKI